MVCRPAMLVLGLVIVPATSFSQSYEWLDRWYNQPWDQDTYDPRGAGAWDVEASEYGVYSTGEIECNYDDSCQGFIAKFRAEDGKRLWRYKIELQDYTYGSALTVNEHGVFVVGYAADIDQFGRQVYGGFVQAYSHDGSVLWTVQDVQVDRASSDIVFDDDGLYVVGSTLGFGGNAVVRHISFDGDVLWTVELGNDTQYGEGIMIDAGTLYVTTFAGQMDVLQTDGTYAGRIPVSGGRANSAVLRDGAIYRIAQGAVEKVGLDGAVAWSTPFDTYINNMTTPSALAASEDGLVVATVTTRLYPNGNLAQTGRAYAHLDFDGNVLSVEELPGHELYDTTLSVHDGTIYSGGGDAAKSAYTARLNPKDLLPPSLLTLASASPSQAPRLAVLEHDYGAGPVWAAIREAIPGSPKQIVKFSRLLKPVAFEKAPDLNGNAYEELVVLSRLPAVVEVRDSFDGSLLTHIKLGSRFEPAAAAVDAISPSPRIGVVERNRDTGRLLLRVYGLPDGALLGTVALNRSFDPVDMVTMPTSAGPRFAILARNQVAGSPHKIEIVDVDGAPATRFWIRYRRIPIEIEQVAGASGPALVVPWNDSPSWSGVRLMYLEGDYEFYELSRARFPRQHHPIVVAMAARGNAGTDGHPQVIAMKIRDDGRVKAEARDTGSGDLDYRITLDKQFHPLDAAYIDARQASGAEQYALLVRRDPDDWGYPSEIRAIVVDADSGKAQFILPFHFPD